MRENYNALCLSKIYQFSKCEYLDKKPLDVIIFKVVDEKVFDLIQIPEIKTNLAPYIVGVEYLDLYRAYWFTTEGNLINGKNLDKDPQFSMHILRPIRRIPSHFKE
ncbi:MAG: hypothetical protein P8Y97_21615 [Candidatus Lokiarchaeota archaeon]